MKLFYVKEPILLSGSVGIFTKITFKKNDTVIPTDIRLPPGDMKIRGTWIRRRMWLLWNRHSGFCCAIAKSWTWMRTDETNGRILWIIFRPTKWLCLPGNRTRDYLFMPRMKPDGMRRITWYSYMPLIHVKSWIWHHLLKLFRLHAIRSTIILWHRRAINSWTNWAWVLMWWEPA